MNLRKVLTAVLALATVMFVAAPARADEPATAQITVFWTSLVARGVAVDVSFGVSCPAGFTGTATVSVTQTRDDGLSASGQVTDDLVCTGTGRPELSRPTAVVTGAPFDRGGARLDIVIAGCDGSTCFTTPLRQHTRLGN
ncbi:hypothetical protein KOI35_24940 [Actinoplanes bogorensis]|uniref:Uncharacterized protein n=1 Tax=Paractinoplanes bogorensis TaxID=1610840 RepID=A0ABS5YTH4_9ACTN|nr:hypothetical protein [Actinoplanes bogorensis]MBU2666761.1 hypothetical protein [Actinoplanes bogorensis]